MVSLHAAVLAVAVSAGGETALLDFYADWCGPCRQMDPAVQALAAKGYPVRKVNVDQHRDLAAQHRVGPIPCFVMLVNGREVAREVGHTDPARLEQMCRMAQRPVVARSQDPGPKTRGGLPIPVIELGAPASPASPSSPAPPFREPPPADLAGPAADGPPPRPAGNPGAAARLTDDDLIACTVRLRIGDGNGHSCGSGTIIDARQGQALVLTCGHIFRDSQGKGRIEVDLFGPNPARKLPGRLVAWDEKRDLGLVSIAVPGPVRAARVAPAGYAVAQGDRVLSAGCDHGADPTVRPSRVVSLDRYVGPPNLQIDDQPVEGRSGGGLFTPDGLVIGVCNARDPADRQGLFAAAGTIHAQLDEARLQFVYQDVPPMPRRMPRPDEGAVAEAPARDAAPPSDSLPLLPPAPREGQPGGRAGELTRDESALLEEVRRRQARGAEVIFIVRPLDAPQAKSEVFVLDRASPALLERLEGGAQSTEIRETSLAVPAQTPPAQDKPGTAPIAGPSRPRTRAVLPPPVPLR